MNSMTRLILPATLLALTAAPLVVQAGSPVPPTPDIEGTWDGKISCTGIVPESGSDGTRWEKVRFSEDELSMEITAIDEALFDAVVEGDVYNGYIAGDPNRPDEKGIATMSLDEPTGDFIEEAVHFSLIRVFDAKGQWHKRSNPGRQLPHRGKNGRV